jgi:hypothetical protein
MAYFVDLSDYTYFVRPSQPSCVNIGWLNKDHPFDQRSPTEDVLSALWSHCMISVLQTRGLHQCDLCPPPTPLVVASRSGDGLRLGSAEIRVFSLHGEIYACPNLIYHYVRTHHYKPPGEFLTALNEGPRPQAPEYFECLKKAGLDWGQTHRYPGDTRKSRPVITGSRSETVDGVWRRIEMEFPVFLDED